jgi:hypothetical protein
VTETGAKIAVVLIVGAVVAGAVLMLIYGVDLFEALSR